MKQIFTRNNAKDTLSHVRTSTEKNVHMINEWNWKLEQSLTQLRSRINAIENRLSLSSENITDSISIDEKSRKSNNVTVMNADVEGLKELIDSYEKTLHQLDKEYKGMNEELTALMKKQKSSSVIMHVKGKEIPLEVSGLIGGIFVIIIAIIVGFGRSDLVISPPFLSCIGLILIGSTLFRSFGVINVVKSFYNNHITSK